MNVHQWKPQQWLRRLKQTSSRRLLALATYTVLATTGFAAAYYFTSNRQTAALIFADPEFSAFPAVPAISWGFPHTEYSLTEDELHAGDVLGEILMKQGLTYPQVSKIVENSKGKFNINSMRIGKKLHFIAKTAGGLPQFMVYEPSPYTYTLFQLTEPFEVKVVQRDVHTETVAASGVLETSFWQALTDNGLNDELADGMIDVLASSVDFYHQKQGDRFKVVFEQHYVDGQPVGTGDIIAAVYEREGKESYAFNYEKPNENTKYFDFEGRPAKKAFLKSPLKFSRISSRYNLHRMHPILGYTRAHLGTDYAAPQGTPILAVADGTVLEATRRGGNGNFVKIRHDGTYQTQYLHMSGFAKGIRPGTHVSQGQTIGYVGSTGLATGPHVCFRFWKNGCEVDHLRLNLPSAQPMAAAEFEKFKPVRDRLAGMLNSVQYHTQEELLHEKTDAEKWQRINP